MDASHTSFAAVEAGRRMQGANTNININFVKVFTATKARDRASLGERVTAWLGAHPSAQISSSIVRLSSDRAFHCLSIVFVGYDPTLAEKSE